MEAFIIYKIKLKHITQKWPKIEKNQEMFLSFFLNMINN